MKINLFNGKLSLRGLIHQQLGYQRTRKKKNSSKLEDSPGLGIEKSLKKDLSIRMRECEKAREKAIRCFETRIGWTFNGKKASSSADAWRLRSMRFTFLNLKTTC